MSTLSVVNRAETIDRGVARQPSVPGRQGVAGCVCAPRPRCRARVPPPRRPRRRTTRPCRRAAGGGRRCTGRLELVEFRALIELQVVIELWVPAYVPQAGQLLLRGLRLIGSQRRDL